LLKKHPKSALVADTRLALARYHLKVTKDNEAAQKQLVEILSFWPKSKAADHALVLLADLSLKKGDEDQARKNLELVLRKKDSSAKDEAEFLIGDLNMKRLKSPVAAPGDEVYTLKAGDTLYVLSKRLKVPQDLLIGINNLDPRALTIGKKIRIPHLNISLVIDKAKRTLTIRNNNDFLKKYHVGLNQDDSKLPAKDYSVGKKSDKGMEYTKPNSNDTIKAGAPDNPYGKYYIELGSSAGIHGTNDEEKVGKLVSDGIVVMSNQDIEEVYALVQPKTKVTVKNSVNTEASSAK
jgi:LysM repeat protein